MKTWTTGARAAWLALCLLLILISAGCAGSLLSKPQAAPMRHTLDAGAPSLQAPREVSAGAPTIMVATPVAAPGFDSARMVYLRHSQALETFAFHAWVDTPAHMLAPLLVRELQRSGAFRAVVRAPSAAAGGLRLETEIVRLQQDFTMRPSRVRLTLRVVLVDMTTRQPVAWREFDDIAMASSDDPAGGAAAALVVTQRMLSAMASFIAGQVAVAPASDSATTARPK